MATMAFWTDERVTSGGRFFNSLASSCRVHAMPKSEVAGLEDAALCCKVK